MNTMDPNWLALVILGGWLLAMAGAFWALGRWADRVTRPPIPPTTPSNVISFPQPPAQIMEIIPPRRKEAA